jgi:hypothetical protein
MPTVTLTRTRKALQGHDDAADCVGNFRTAGCYAELQFFHFVFETVIVYYLVLSSEISGGAFSSVSV